MIATFLNPSKISLEGGQESVKPPRPPAARMHSPSSRPPPAFLMRRRSKRIASFFPIAIHPDVVAGQYRAFEDLHREWILNQSLDRPAQRTRTVRRVVPFPQEQFIGRGRQLESDLTFRQQASRRSSA